LRRWRAIVFDLDDTLYPEPEFVASGFRAVAKWAEQTLGIDSVLGLAELHSIHGRGPKGHTFNEWLVMHNLDKGDWAREAVRVYREHDPAIKPFPEVPALLSSFKGRYLLGLVSDGYLDVQRRKLRALGLADCFDATVFSDEWGREAWKPSPRPFQILLERFGHLPGEKAVYVGDNPAKDFLGARRAGMTSVQVRRPYGVYADVVPLSAEYRADCVISALNELPLALERMGKVS
jgi:putative hydrolase of the HAD superfamily